MGKNKLLVYESRVQAGFPSPAGDRIECKLDLNEYLVKHPAATFFVRAAGDAMVNAGIHDNDILIVDRSIGASNNKIVIAVVNGKFIVRRICVRPAPAASYLQPENKAYPAIKLNGDLDMCIWGVVTAVIHRPE